LNNTNYRCGIGADQTKFENCVLGCDDDTKQAYYCKSSSSQDCQYNTTNIVPIPDPVATSFYPLYNTDAFHFYGKQPGKCGISPDDPPDTYCSQTSPGNQTKQTLTDVILSTMSKDENDQSQTKLQDVQQKVLEDFTQDAFAMRQSPLGYKCLPVKRQVQHSPEDPEGPQGYRYVMYALDEPEKRDKCTVLDCADAALGKGISHLSFDDKSKACLATICEGDGCPAIMTNHDLDALQNDPDSPYCNCKSKTLSDNDILCHDSLPDFLSNNCPKNLRDFNLDCVPANNNSVLDGSWGDPSGIYRDLGLQMWKHGQLDLQWCVNPKTSHIQRADGDPADGGDPNYKFNRRDERRGWYQVGNTHRVPEGSGWVCPETTNLFDFLGQTAFLQEECCNDWRDGEKSLEHVLPLTLSSQETADLTPNATLSFSTKVNFSIINNPSCFGYCDGKLDGIATLTPDTT
jgi:hypothetical protein